jgi:hypothetical protein
MRRRSIIRVVAALIVACGLSARAQATDLSGCWSGSWQSCSTGHAGVLRATFTRCDDTHYRVDFSGRFFKILPFRYSVTLQVVEETEETVKLSGSSYLGKLFGTFCYTATVTDCQFRADYTSKKDRGVFTLTRQNH